MLVTCCRAARLPYPPAADVSVICFLGLGQGQQGWTSGVANSNMSAPRHDSPRGRHGGLAGPRGDLKRADEKLIEMAGSRHKHGAMGSRPAAKRSSPPLGAGG